MLCLLCWILEAVIGVSAALVAVFGAVLCFGFKILEPKEIATCVPWGLIIFIGSVMQMGSMFSLMGISDWISVVLTPVFSSITNVYLLVAVIVLLVYLIRFALASQAAVITLIIIVLNPIVSKMGISPFVLGLIAFTSMQVWFMPYQNTTYMAAFGAGASYVKHSDVAKSCIAFCIISLVANLICIPYWQMFGYII